MISALPVSAIPSLSADTTAAPAASTINTSIILSAGQTLFPDFFFNNQQQQVFFCRDFFDFLLLFMRIAVADV
jgi:hypothetical protein